MKIRNRFGRRGGPHSLAAPYALDALDAAERLRFERHLERCDRCAAEVRGLAEDAARLACSTAAPAPAELRARVLAAIRTTPQEPGTGPAPGAKRGRAARARDTPWSTDPPGQSTEAPRSATEAPRSATEAPRPATEASRPATEASGPAVEASGPATEARWPATEVPRRATGAPRRATGAPRRVTGAPRRPLFVPFATVTAAAALVVAALFAVQADRTRDELAAERDRAAGIARVLAAPDARADTGRDGRGRGLGVIASAAEGRAVVTLSGYGAPPDDRVHQLWLMRPGTRPRSLGLLDGDTPLVASGLDRSASALAVTVEPAGGSARPSTSPIVQLALESVGFGE